MSIRTVCGRIRYIEASDDPLSADVGIVETAGGVWLYDVGCGERALSQLPDLAGGARVVLSHFHSDHVGNVDRIPAKTVYLSAETFKHVRRGTVVRGDLYDGDVHVFPLPSCHAKGCLGLEVEETWAFVGDALYCRVKDGFYIYNAQLLKKEIEALRALRSPYLLVSHRAGLLREKEAVIEELSSIYGMKEKHAPEIRIPIGSK